MDKLKYLIYIFFYVPIFYSCLNLQVFITNFISVSLGQISAYLMIAFIFAGILLVLKKSEEKAPLIKLWIAFYFLYYTFSLIASAVLGNEADILKTLVYITYFLGFSVLLSIPEYRKLTLKVLTITFFTTTLLLIYFKFINFSVDVSGIYEYNLDRAGGVYGDANNAAVSSLLSFIFINQSLKNSKNKYLKYIKLVGMLISFYAVLLTFSKTGFVVALLVIMLVNYKLFTPKRILFTIIFVPILLIGSINLALSSGKLSTVQQTRVENIASILTLETDNVGLSGRDYLLQNMLNYINENPIIGNGLRFSNIIRGHNTILGVWADAGIFTFIFFIILLITYVKSSFTSNSNVKYFSLAILCTLYIFMLSLQTIINQGYIMVVFVYLAYNINDNQIKKHEYKP
ncbi:hypothetical protein Celal_3135 [Cellulophaga algicola DSM 14237]|uniref:O-antigen ligase-related domain-containing protein n=1 Tax=Cellulophaga algicola (strain DSM 14237 / IC166 / ACAM 630) TaxID=688270 RepID=E6X467_CELAD|nr:O-antigen ligase family protein [Cellulophaga algicola]ADV50409.1 hypothetical protein Celal_3135 [Cellulophaga algicola DSM 14237]